MSRSERMATFDAAWLHMDHAENRMVITGVLWLESPIGLDDLVAVLQERLVERYPRFQQRIVRGTLGEPRWELDPCFDLRSHLLHVGLAAPGGRPALERLVSQLMGAPLEPARPPWQFILVDGYLGGVAIVARLHHVIADGISLARVLLGLTDDGEVEHVPPPTGEGPTGVVRPFGELLRASAAAGGRLVDRGRALWQHPERWAEAARLGGGSAVALSKLATLTDDPPSPIKGPLGPLKQVAWSDGVPLARVRSIARGLGGTINDVLLTALAAALGRYLRERGADVAELRTLVPINLRDLERPLPRELGNRFGLVFLSLPLEHCPPRQRFDELKRRMDALKGSPEPALTFAMLTAVGGTPLQVERAVVDLFGAKASLITTNVPGPSAPLSLAGSQVAGVLFWVPQSGAVGLGVSLFSYAGRVLWGISADVGLVPDPDRLVLAVHAALDELESVATQP